MEVGALRVLPLHVMVLGLAAAMLYFTLIWRRESNIVVRFLVLAFWLRYMGSEFPTYTFQTVGGLSIISLISLSTIAIGILVMGFRMFKSPIAIPCYFLMAANIVSGVTNGFMGGAIDASIKSIYFLTIATAATRAFLAIGTYRVAQLLLIALAVPLTFQYVGFVFGVAKASEADGSASVIGGYNHESGFSMVALTVLLVVGIFAASQKSRGLGLMAIGLVSLLLANYRTSMLAGLPIIAAIVFATTNRGIRANQRILVTIIVLPIVGLFIFAGISFQDRFVDLFATAGDYDRLFVLPDHYSVDERRLLSGRPYIWSQYLSRYLSGGDIQLLIGNGPSSWEGNFKVYAHNTLVSALYDTGIIGFIASFAFLSIFMLMSARSLKGPHGSLILFSFAGFFILNMSTMPIWSIEGLLFYALLVGLSFSESQRLSPAYQRYLTRSGNPPVFSGAPR